MILHQTVSDDRFDAWWKVTRYTSFYVLRSYKIFWWWVYSTVQILTKFQFLFYTDLWSLFVASNGTSTANEQTILQVRHIKFGRWQCCPDLFQHALWRSLLFCCTKKERWFKCDLMYLCTEIRKQVTQKLTKTWKYRFGFRRAKIARQVHYGDALTSTSRISQRQERVVVFVTDFVFRKR